MTFGVMTMTILLFMMIIMADVKTFLFVITMIMKNPAATTNIVMSVMAFRLSSDDRDKLCRHDEYYGGYHGVSIIVKNMTNFAVVMNIMVNVVMAFRLS